MSELKIFEYNGSSITFEIDGETYVNATEMAKPFSKTVKDWTRLKGTSSFINALEKAKGQISLLEIKKGGDNPGTIMHEDLALEFARWLSPEFGIWCNDRIKELLTTGQTSNQPKPLTNSQMMLLQAKINVENEKTLLEHDNRIARLEASKTTRPMYFTVAGYATLNKVSVNLKQASILGRKASKQCREKGLQTDECSDPRWGVVKMYPKEVLQIVFDEFKVA